MTSIIKPMLCADPKALPATGGGWIMEPKYDGWRLIVHCHDGRVTVFGGRNGKEYTGQLPYLEDELARVLPPDSIIDGELLSPEGFNTVQSVMRAGVPHEPPHHGPALRFVAFDVLRVHGTDTRMQPWRTRRGILDAPDYGASCAYISVSPFVEGADPAQAEAWIAEGYEGVVCKRDDSPYVSRKDPRWIKFKPQTTDEAKVVGFKPGEAGGQFDGMVGAFEVEMLGSGARTTVKCGTFAVHESATNEPEKWLGTVIEVKHHGLGKTGVPRHPQFLRRRDDRTAPAAAKPAKAPTGAAPAGGRMRNYSAMGVAKLEKCLRELQDGEGTDAYDRCMNGGSGDPDADIAKISNVLRAKRAAA